MMRQALLSSLAAGSLVVTSAGMAMAEAQRVEVPGAGIAVTFPAGWQTEMLMDEYEMAVPPGTDRSARVLTLLGAWSPDGVNCGLEMFEDNPLSLEEHVAWVEQVNREDSGFVGSVNHVPVQLPVGKAIRVDGDHQADGVWTTVYFFDSSETRYLMYCAHAARAADDYLSIAETIELLEPVPPGVPDDALDWTQVEDFGSTLPVSETTAMRAWCELALWIEHADGTFEEHLECTLTDDPVDPADTQGFLPDASVTLSGGACEWLSDFWLTYDGSEVVATSWAAVIEPDGSFTGLAHYAPELLECHGA